MRFVRLHSAQLVSAVVPALARAAETVATKSEKLKDFGLASSDAGSLPIGRVILVFLLVAALAWAITWMLRRYGFRGAASIAGSAATIRPVARNTMPGGVTCHL